MLFGELVKNGLKSPLLLMNISMKFAPEVYPQNDPFPVLVFTHPATVHCEPDKYAPANVDPALMTSVDPLNDRATLNHSGSFHEHIAAQERFLRDRSSREWCRDDGIQTLDDRVRAEACGDGCIDRRVERAVESGDGGLDLIERIVRGDVGEVDLRPIGGRGALLGGAELAHGVIPKLN